MAMNRLEKLLQYEDAIKSHGYNFCSGRSYTEDVEKLQDCCNDIDNVITSIIYVMNCLDAPLFESQFPLSYFDTKFSVNYPVALSAIKSTPDNPLLKKHRIFSMKDEIRNFHIKSMQKEKEIQKTNCGIIFYQETMAGASDKEIDRIADQLIKEDNIKLDRAKEILKNIK